MLVSKSMVKNVTTVNKDTTIIKAQQIMAKHKFRHLPVVDNDQRLLGIVTDRDIRSALPSMLLDAKEIETEIIKIKDLMVKDIMTANPTTIPLHYTIQDALLLIQQKRVGAFPVVDENNYLKGIVSVRDLLNAFINVLGINQPGVLLGIVAENKIGEMKKIVDAITEENISVGSILLSNSIKKGKCAIFPYLFTLNVSGVKKKLHNLGFTLLNPMEWYLDQIHHKE